MSPERNLDTDRFKSKLPNPKTIGTNLAPIFDYLEKTFIGVGGPPILP